MPHFGFEDGLKFVLRTESGPVSLDEAVYRERFWDGAGCELLESPVNVIHFDAGVCHGLTTAFSLLAFSSWAPDQSPARRGFAYLTLRYALYMRIAAADKTQIGLLLGWKNRLDALRRFVGL